jgi:4-methyl-5(b-hydroxyethyl)-thiazole monophosphate biosynthesis
MSKVALLLAEGFEEIEALSVADILRRAEINVELISVDNKEFVSGAHGIKIIVDKKMSEIDFNEVAMVVLPGGLPGAENLTASAEVNKVVEKFYKEEKWLAAICAAPMVYGKLGILNGKRATCYPGWEKHLKGAVYLKDKVVVDGKFITSQGPATAPYFALKIVEILKGKEVANQLSVGMLYSSI